MDLESRTRWEDYTKAKEEMLERTHIPEAPWWVVQAVDKKRARLNCIAHLLEQIPYEEVAPETRGAAAARPQPRLFRARSRPKCTCPSAIERRPTAPVSSPVHAVPLIAISWVGRLNMSDEYPELDRLQAEYKNAVEAWIAAIRSP